MRQQVNLDTSVVIFNPEGHKPVETLSPSVLMDEKQKREPEKE